ncbi:lysosomal alpha-mannosidase isoform X4 [Ixodes scapularis]|nr:lysosomal alpha-mannosidase isoform X4 [Ixodes scapularis]
MADFILDDIAIQAKAYATKNIMLTIGGDLSFQNAQNWFNQVDSAIRMVNNVSHKKGRRVRMFYSTPLCYLASLHAANQSWPVFRGDLFPYADNPNRAWTGFYTSRPNLKGFARYANGFLQACKQLAVIGGKRDTRTQRLKEAVAILQHHDAITGTSKHSVAEDYSLLLWKGIVDCEAVIGSAVTKLTGQSEANVQWGFCHAFNISQCAITESWGVPGPNEQHSGPTELTVLVYNPMSQALSTYVRLPVNDGHSFEVRDYQGRDTEPQVTPLIMTIPNIPDRRSCARSELVIPVELPPLGYTTFYATKRAKPEAQIMERNINFLQLEPEYRFIENDRYRLEVDMTTGLLLHITFLGLELAMSLKQSFYVYKMAVPGHQFTVSAGGAYTFLPDRDEPFDLGSHVTYRIVKGNHVQEIHQIFSHWVSQVIRLYKKSEFIEFEWIIGPIPDNRENIDIVTRYETRLDNGDVFFTDSNGLETIQRRWVKLNESVYPQSVASNYYPVVSWIYLKGQTRNLQMTVITDRAQGGTSPQQGCLELMLHRRYFVDDDLGVQEALDDRGAGGEGIVVKGKHFVHLGTPREALLVKRRASLQQVYQPVVLFTHTPFAPIPKKQHSELRAHLPEGLHLMSLENVAEDQALLRLEHTLFEGMLNTSITHFLSSFLVVDIKETVLSGHLYLTELSKTEHEQPKATRSVAAVPVKTSFQELNNVLVTLRPGQIRTFLAKLQPFTGPSRAGANTQRLLRQERRQGRSNGTLQLAWTYCSDRPNCGSQRRSRLPHCPVPHPRPS